MAESDGTLIQNRDIEKVPSKRRNPTIAEIFHRLDYVERQGSGLRKIRTETSYLHGFSDELSPKFVSAESEFHVILYNMNYIMRGSTMHDNTHDNTHVDRMAELLEYCEIARTRDELQQYFGIANREYFRKAILKPLLDSGQLKMTLPDKLQSKKQRYIRG